MGGPVRLDFYSLIYSCTNLFCFFFFFFFHFRFFLKAKRWQCPEQLGEVEDEGECRESSGRELRWLQGGVG